MEVNPLAIFKHATKEDIEPCDWHLRVRITYEDYVTVKAKDYHEACKLAERYVFDNMNDGVESTTDIEEFNPDDYA